MPLKFPARSGLPELPLVGEACRVTGGFYTALVVCNCDAQTALLLPQGAIEQCPACHRAFAVDGMQVGRDGDIACRIRVGTLPPSNQSGSVS